MNDQQNMGPWQQDEITILLDCIELYGGRNSLLIAESSKKIGRSEKSITRRLVKMGYLSRVEGGFSTFHRAVGHRN